jgi:hypothetical protein
MLGLAFRSYRVHAGHRRHRSSSHPKSGVGLPDPEAQAFSISTSEQPIGPTPGVLSKTSLSYCYLLRSDPILNWMKLSLP